jgi:hypothetical protein
VKLTDATDDAEYVIWDDGEFCNFGWFNPKPLQSGTPSLFTYQFQAKPCRCSRGVASIIERIDESCASNPMVVRVGADSTAG